MFRRFDYLYPMIQGKDSYWRMGDLGIASYFPLHILMAIEPVNILGIGPIINLIFFASQEIEGRFLFVR